MVTPADYALTIILNGNDISTLCPHDLLGQEDNLRTPGYFSLTVQAPTFVPLVGHHLLVIAKTLAGTPSIFSGFVLEVEGNKRDNTLASNAEYRIEAGDMKVLLEKSIVPVNEYAGTDADIISDLFNDVYPDLSNYFDFTSGVDGFTDDMSFNTNDESLLDSLNRLADRTGAKMRLETRTGELSELFLTFTPYSDPIEEAAFGTGGATPYWTDYPVDNATTVLSSSGGNTGWCAKGTWNHSPPIDSFMVFRVHMGQVLDIENISFDVYVTQASGAGLWTFANFGSAVGTIAASETIEKDRWFHFDCAEISPGSFPFSTGTDGAENPVFFQINYGSITGASGLEVFIDNVRITASLSVSSGNADKLIYSPIAESAPFDLDIQNGDEFAFDINEFTGSIDNFNSITVIGGKEQVAIDWTYDADGASERIQLEAPVRSIVIQENTGSDTSPSWNTLVSGVFGTHDLIADGGTREVVYDPRNHWLLFDVSAIPANMTKSIRITGFIEKPIRVRVENVANGDLTYAKVVKNEDLTSEEDAISFANGILNKKNMPHRLNFVTHEPGIKAGHEMRVIDSTRNMDLTLIVTKVSTKWFSPKGYAEFRVECGEDEVTSLDSLVAAIDKKATGKGEGAAFTTLSIEKLLDSNNEELFDSAGQLLYQIG